MKTVVNIILMLFCVTAFSQEQKVEFKKVDNDLIKATYYFADNSSVIEREGFFNKNEKLHGMWVSYDVQGNKIAIAYYNNGKKDGVWSYFKDGKVNLVTYDNNKIINVEEKIVAVN
jgi:antitoxin component YwqK of YwqJK toxin-antitoxin module